MAKREKLTFTDEEREQFAYLRFHHPHPRVQQRMEMFWLMSQGQQRNQAAKLAGVSRTTGWRYVQAFRAGGVAKLCEFDWVGPVSALAAQAKSLEEEFLARPPHTVPEAVARIKELTKIERGPTQVRQFLRRTLGLKWRRVAALPIPPKKVSTSMSRPSANSSTPNWSRA
jgi:transposase